MHSDCKVVCYILKSVGLIVILPGILILGVGFFVDRSSVLVSAPFVGCGLFAFVAGSFGLVLIDIEDHLRSLASKLPTAKIANDAKETAITSVPDSSRL